MGFLMDQMNLYNGPTSSAIVCAANLTSRVGLLGLEHENGVGQEALKNVEENKVTCKKAAASGQGKYRK